MKTNRIFALLLAAVMLLSIFAGCNTVEPNVTDPSGSIGSADHTGTDGTDSTTGTTGTTGSDPAGNETISGTETTEPSTPPTTAPATQPTEPETEPTTQPTEPATEPSVRPTEPATEPTECSHSWLEWTTDSAATCEANGTKSRKCSRCGHTQTETIAATGHSWDDGTISADLGIMTYTCKTCGKTRTEQMSSDHTFGEWTWEEYTFQHSSGGTYTSHRKYRTCTKCGYKETDGTADHICQKGSDNHVVTTVKEGTCSTKATMRSTCKVCGWYVEYAGSKAKCSWVDKEVHLSDYGTYTNELDALVSECSSCGDRAVVYYKGEGWSDYNRYRVNIGVTQGSAYAPASPINDNMTLVDHPEWQTVKRDFVYDSDGYVKQFTIYWWYNGSRYSQVINCGEGEMEAWFAQYGLTATAANSTYTIRIYGTEVRPYKISYTG